MTNSKDSKWTPEYRKEYAKEWQKKNRDKIKETQKKWREENPDYQKELREKRKKENSIEDSETRIQNRKKEAREARMKNPIKSGQKRVSDPKGREEIPLELVQDFAERFKGNILENKS